MPLQSWAATTWPTLRYERIFPLARRSRRAARACAALVGTVEYLIDPVRREVASRRIARTLRLPLRRARAFCRASLVSEALEESEIEFLMTNPDALAGVFSAGPDEPAPAGGTLYATLHFGNPVLAYLHLAWWRRLDVTTVSRALSADNPMADAKRRYGQRRIAWIERLARPLLALDGTSAAHARELILAGRSLFAPIDVPGDVVTRARDVDFLGERMRFASGMITLARICKAPVQPLDALSRPGGFVVRWGGRVEPSDDARMHADAFGELLAFVRELPGEWWMWPYLVVADEPRV